MTGKLYINGVDAWTSWGVYLEDGSYDKFLSGDSVKEYTTNRSRAIDGVQIHIKNPKLEERNLTVIFCFSNKGGSFLSRYNSFLNFLLNGVIVDNQRYPNEVRVVELGMTYRLVYEGNTNLTQSGLSIGKVAVRFLEPNPANRS